MSDVNEFWSVSIFLEGLLLISVRFFLPPTDGISDHLYVSQSVICEMATVQERARCVGWPPRSADITPLDFFL
jgi:hypothetical protein